MVRHALAFAVIAALGPVPAADATDAAWFGSVARAESAMAVALARGAVDSASRSHVAEQARLGARALATVLAAPTASESLLAGPLLAPPPPPPRRSPWGDRFMRATHVVGVTTHLLNLAGSWYGMSHETRVALAYVGGGAGGAGAVFNLVRPRSAPPPGPDPHETIRSIGREWTLREACDEASRAVAGMAAELRAIAAAPCSTGDQSVELTRRYAAALPRAAAVVDFQVSRAATAARSGSEYAPYSGNSRDRLAELAARWETLAAAWHQRRTLATRSERNALAYLVLADRP